jgi:hypothetical protein
MSKHTSKQTSSFATKASALVGQAEILSPGSCVETHHGPSVSTRRSTMFKQMMSFVAVVGLVLTATSAHAVTIVWDTPTAITSNENILNPSQVGVDGGVALNYNDATPGPLVVSVGGTDVTFQDTQTPLNAGGYNNNMNTGIVGADFEAVLDENRYAEDSSHTYSFTGLNDGEQYQLQVFSAGGGNLGLNVGGSHSGFYAFTGGATATLGDGGTGGTGPGEYVNGLVSLGSGETSFDLLINNFGNTGGYGHLNAIVLTLVPSPVVPEPSSIAIWSLLGICLAGYGYRRRRRNS